MRFSIYGDQLTGIIEVPSMKGTNEASFPATPWWRNLRTSVSADIQKGAELAVRVACKQKRLASLIGGKVGVVVR